MRVNGSGGGGSAISCALGFPSILVLSGRYPLHLNFFPPLTLALDISPTLLCFHPARRCLAVNLSLPLLFTIAVFVFIFLGFPIRASVSLGSGASAHVSGGESNTARCVETSRGSRLLLESFHCSCCKHASLPFGFSCQLLCTHTHRDHMFSLPSGWTPVQEHYLFKATNSAD